MSAVASLESPFQVSGRPAVSLVADDVPEHGPQHALGRGRRHGLRASHVLGRARSLQQGAGDFASESTEQGTADRCSAKVPLWDCSIRMNEKRTAPFLAKLPAGTRLTGATCQADADGQTLCRLDMPPIVGCRNRDDRRTAAIAAADRHCPRQSRPPTTPPRLDPANGALASLKLKPSGRELLAKPVLVVAERGGDYHETQPSAESQTACRFRAVHAGDPGREGTFGHGGADPRKVLRRRRTAPDDSLLRRRSADRLRGSDRRRSPTTRIVVVEFPFAPDNQGNAAGYPLRILARGLGQAESRS